MIIFTPNTLIQSADVNYNFAEHETRLDALDTTTSTAYASGTVGSGTGTGYLTLTELENSNLTFASSNQYTVTIEGLYYIHIQQLWLDAGSSSSLYININGSDQRRGWIKASEQKDVYAHMIVTLDVGDIIRFRRSTAITTAWSGGHSSYGIALLRGGV